MKKKSLISKTFAAWLILPALTALVLTFSSCQKNDSANGILPSSVSAESKEQGERMRASVAKELSAFANRNSSNRTSDFTDPAYNYTTYSTPSTNVYQWSNPTTGTVFTLTESTGGSGSGGLGQLAYDNKSFDYNYVFTIKASSSDPIWSGFLNGRDLLGVVAIDAKGDIATGNFTLRNFAIFLVATSGGAGTYEFYDFSSTNVSNTFAHHTERRAVAEVVEPTH